MGEPRDPDAPPVEDDGWPAEMADVPPLDAEYLHVIRGSPADWHRQAANKACEHLAALPEVFLDRDRSMLWIDDAVGSPPAIRYVLPATVPDLLGRANVAFQSLVSEKTEDGETRTRPRFVPIPSVLCQTVVSRRPANVRWRRFEGFASGPYLLDSGDVVDAHGYAEERGLWLPHAGLAELRKTGKGSLRARGFSSIDEGRAALDWVTAELREFPWADPAMGPAVWLGYLMTLATRPAYEHAPLFLFEASRPRSGKDLLFKCAEIVAHSRTAYRITLVENPDENEKRIATGLLAGHSTLIFGDVARLGSPLLLSLITEGSQVVIRLLGTNTTIPVPRTLVLGANANNVTFNVPDLVPRTIGLRLDPPTSTPDTTPHALDQDELQAHFRRLRPAMLCAVFNAIRGYLHRRKDPETDPHGISCGSFPGWARLVRDPLLYYGYPDLMETQATLRKQVPVGEQGALDALYAAWWAMVGERPVTSGNLIAMAARTEQTVERDDGNYGTVSDPNAVALADALSGLFEGKASPRKLTSILRKQRDALPVVGDIRLKLVLSTAHNQDAFALVRVR